MIVVVGAGSAGRSAARLLNHLGSEVVVTDLRGPEEFTGEEREYLAILEREGVELVLGEHPPELFDRAEAVFVSPAIPEDAPVMKLVEKVPEKITVEDVAHALGKLFPIPCVGVTGTNGKTTTVWALSAALEGAGYDVWRCSSLDRHLVIEAIIDGVVSGEVEGHDVAVLELPHGTLRMAAGVRLDVGVLTNVKPEHLDEFGGSFKRYVRRKLTILDMADEGVVGWDCENVREVLSPGEVVRYGVRRSDVEYRGQKEENALIVEGPDVEVEVIPFRLVGYYVENCTGAVAAALEFGADPDGIEEGLARFEGVPGRMEFLGEFSGRVAYMDAAHNEDGMEATLPTFRKLADDRDGRLLLGIDNPDTVTERNKLEIGRIAGRYADVVVASARNETLEKIDRKAAREVAKGAESEGCEVHIVDTVEEEAELLAALSEDGDVILHIGPGVVNAYDRVKREFLKGLESVLGGG